MFNWLQSLPFVAPGFFLAGVLCALGPVVIHLLNRRRFRVVNWAAMDFLREALQRNRKIMQLRDILLMALRTLAVLLLGAALARTSCSVSNEKFDASKPLHAVVLIDNSLSMGYQSLDGSLLDLAKSRAAEYIERLPPGSRITVAPVGGSRQRPTLEPFRTNEEALAALRRIELVDRSVNVQQAVNLAAQAVEAEPELAKRLLLFSDQQRGNWSGLLEAEQIARLPRMQLIEVAPETSENVWVADLTLQDGLADVDTPATLVALVRGANLGSAQDVQVALEIDGTPAAARIVQLDAGDSTREVRFEYRFDGVRPEPGQPEFVPVSVSLQPDRLPADDRRSLVVPVVSALPVVFVDQFGGEAESVVNQRIGETRPLRKLLAPGARGGDELGAPQLISIRHLTLEQLDRDVLADARLVVMAGIAEPGPAVDLLREYVQQGGQLILAAGGAFDAGSWHRDAWRGGLGILPMPLEATALGALPAETDSLQPFFLDFESLRHHDYFQIAGVDESALRDLYAEPFFFKAVRLREDPAELESLFENEGRRLDELAQLEAQRERLMADQQGSAAAADIESQLAAIDKEIADSQPNWLRWQGQRRLEQQAAETETGDNGIPSEAAADGNAADGGDAHSADTPRGERLQRTAPRVLARLDNGAPLLVERQIDHGRVVMLASGMTPEWGTLPLTNTFLIFDRIARGMIESTLPQRNFPAVEQIVLPVDSSSSHLVVELFRPEAAAEDRELLDIGFIGSNQRGVVIENALERGVYRLDFLAPAEGDPAEAGAEAVGRPAIQVAVGGSAEESELTPLGRGELENLAAEGPLFWVGPGEEISLAGEQSRGQDWWRYFIMALLIVLGIEMLIAAGAPLLAGRFGGSARPDAAAAPLAQRA